MKAPTICACVIARNEERDIPKLIASLKGVADYIVLVDTGSTDKTCEVFRHACGDWTLSSCQTYLDASEPNPDKPGEFRLINFAKARNRALELGEATGCSHILVVDADDTIATPLAIRRAAYMPLGVFGCWIELGGGVRQLNHRMWPAAYKIRFHGWIHEWPGVDGFPGAVLNDAMIAHDATPHEGANEDSNARNLRILLKQWEAEPDARCAFYLANTHRDGGRWKEGAYWYMVRLGYGNAWPDEFNFALLYMVRCMEALGDNEQCEIFARLGLDKAPDWQEFRMALAFLYYRQRDYPRAIDEASKALDKPIPPTILWREKSMYKDQPARLISWSHEHLGNLSQALVWSQLASRLIGQYDADWAKRQAVLEQRLNLPPEPQAPAILKGMRPRIALNRPGAIGDILMTLNLIPAFKEANPGVDLHYFCDRRLGAWDALGQFMIQAGVDMIGDSALLDPQRKAYDKVIDLVGYPIAEGYPERPMARHLLSYFAMELLGKYAIKAEEASPGHFVVSEALPQLTLRRPNRPLPDVPPEHDYITWQWRAGWSRYKEFPRFNAVVATLRSSLHLPVIEIDESRGWPLAKSIAVFANARMHVGIDSFCNHLTNYLWTYQGGARRVPGVILWGSTQANAAGYPDNTNISKGLYCQPCFRENDKISSMPRGPCINPPRATYADETPHACMDAITVDEVVAAVIAMWERTKPA